ncbi:putative GPI-anchored protein pfl2 [Drosophila grimshawi]|uniref:GH19127 n=1 Tax=Drosophila grimshawi TaxID=7222 RepID=B4JIM9_DROGR|nr:putative GPI-anchored protein pfl2 [Drosophila grimshawi]EDV93110.1 GH19127 [Drosophila grimshawi]
MFELEDYSSSIHEGFFSKYADAAGPSLDFYVSDSMQDMLDVDIRAEIANVVGSSSDLTSSLDHALEAISAINNSNNNCNSSIASSSTHNANASLFTSSGLHASPTAKWMGSCANFWSTTDYYADIGACVNPISVMPLINSNSGAASLLGSGSPQKSRAAGGGINGSTSTQSSRSGSGSGQAPPASPCGQHKSHLTFSPAQMKVSAGSMRREQVMAHIPKQISALPISASSLNAPATMASNAAAQQQRRNSSAVDAVRKDLGTELRKMQSINDETKSSTSTPKNNTSLLTTGGSATNTIKLGPGIGGLTFANSATYNKLKQQTSVKSPNGAPLTANGNIVLKRDREASPLHNMATLHANGVVQKRGSNAPKSIASAAHSPHHQMHMQNNSIGSPSSTSSSTANGRPTTSSSPLSFAPLTSNNTSNINSNNNNGNSSNTNNMKPLLQQKMKLPAAMSSVFPKPAYSYSCLIALALKNSRAGSLPVSEIYSFLCQHFPYFENAPSGWKNSVRHNLSLNKCFEKIERPATNGNQRKGCRWAMNPERICKMDEEVQKWSRKDPGAIRGAMVYPEHLEALERGEMKHGSADSDVELDSQSEIEESSDLEEHDFDETLIDAMLVEEEENDEVDWANSEEDEDNVQEEHMLQEYEPSNHSTNNLPTDHQLLVAQKSADFDIEVNELYDAIEIDDSKLAVHQAIAVSSQSTSIIELNPADLNVNDGYRSPKRARLDINYAIGPAGELEQQYGQKVKVQQVMQQYQQQAPPTYNRRKMPLVNRII